MWQDTSLVWTQSSLEANIRMNIYLHMTYTWVNMSCFKIQQTSGGSQLPLQAYVLKQEVTVVVPSYNDKITTKEGVTYRKTQSHLKPYSPQCKKSEDEHYTSQSSDMQTVKSNCMQYKTADNPMQSYSRPKRDIKTQVKLDL